MTWQETAKHERVAVVAFLRRVAKAHMKHAHMLLADTMQCKPDADRLEEIA
jgi:hypothetical protein